VLSLYSHSELILGFADGNRSIESIASQVGVDETILITVFSELYRRGYIELKFANITSP
jgi:DNA-binding IscR family transcriptional regulator